MDNPLDIKPRHVGLIPDGARRWALHNNKSYLYSYTITMEKIVQFIDCMYAEGVSSVSVYLLSTDNFKRERKEIDLVINCETHLVKTLIKPTIDQYKVKVIHAGRMDLLPMEYADSLTSIVQSTSANSDHFLYLLSAYNPFDEVTSTFYDHKSFSISRLWVPELLDLVIRTSGEYRLSGFLPLQSHYAEFIFEKKYLNDLSKLEMKSFLKMYQIRKRRFGQ